MPWNPEQYDKFKAERSAPVNDLFSILIIRPGLRVIDLGCGTGEHTRRLADLLPDSIVTGIDNSPQMLEQSKKFERDGLSFKLASFTELEEDYDVIFSNAALQWSPEHPKLISNLWQHLRPGGQLLVQMPKNQDHHSHRLATEIAATEFSQFFSTESLSRKGWVLSIEEYAELLFNLGGEDIIAFMKVYPHVLENSNAVVEWVKGTLLIPFLEALPPEEHSTFIHSYSELLNERMPESPVFYGFKRILFSGVKNETANHTNHH